MSTFFGIGFFPVMPGTLGSLAGVIIYYFLWKGHVLLYAFLLIVLGFFVSGPAERIFGKKDPQPIVIDEVAGMLVAFMLVPFSLKNAVILFILFRIFDIFKPYPIKRLEALPGAAGIMLDDIIAGIYANITFNIVFRFLLR